MPLRSERDVPHDQRARSARRCATRMRVPQQQEPRLPMRCAVLRAARRRRRGGTPTKCTNPTRLPQDICTDAYAASVGIDRAIVPHRGWSATFAHRPRGSARPTMPAGPRARPRVCIAWRSLIRSRCGKYQLRPATRRSAGSAPTPTATMATSARSTRATSIWVLSQRGVSACHTQLAEAREPTRLYYDIRRSVLNESA